jgi:uncharacterized protein (DUF924 family)
MLLTEKEINSILNFWFPNDNYNTFWFDKSVDEIIYKKYFHLLHDTYNATVEKDFEFCYEELLALIILFDQFSRNINRIVNINVTEFTYEARKLSLQCIKNKYYLNKKMNHNCFMLMPLRHLNKLNDYYLLLAILNEIEDNNNIIFTKFKTQTLRKFDLLKD